MSQAIVQADALRPNAVDEGQKAAWVQELDGQLSEMMGRRPKPDRWPEEDRVLGLPPPHEGVYPLYLVCKIDYYNQEMGLYANDMAIYHAALAEAQAWWRRGHRPRRRRRWKTL